MHHWILNRWIVYVDIGQPEFHRKSTEKYFLKTLKYMSKNAHGPETYFGPSQIYLIRSSHRRCSIKKYALKNFAKFTGKHLCQSLFFNKLLKKRLWHRCFPVNFPKFSRTSYLQNSSGRLFNAK